MFGLMRAKTCGMSAVEKRFRRLNYCGTCKTLGSLYGQKTRFLLNFDTVFLSELLTALSLEAKDFSRAYQSYDCLTLPKNESEMPLALQLAATANVVLTEFKLADKIVDEKSRVAKFANKAFSKSFRQAEKRLRDWDFPFDEVRNLLETQSQREAAAGDLDELSLPTAFATANFFSHGARLIGRENEQVNLEKIGYAFGKLIYLLDAFEDFGKDFRRQEFNAIRATYNLNKEKLPANIKRKVVSNLLALQEEIIFNLHELPIADSQKEIFALRLRQNLDRKLKIELPVLQTSKVCRTKPVTFKTRLTNAKIFAKKLTAQSFSAQTWRENWHLPFAFVLVAVVAFVAPAQAKQAKSWQDCAGLGFNLMFLGAVFGAAVAPFKSFLMENPEELLTKKGRRKKAANAINSGDGCYCCTDCCCDCGWLDCCDSCECGACDGCCDCGGCCDGCDCGC